MPDDGHAHPADEEPVAIPMEGTLDLHTFRPQEAAAVVEAFLEESRAHGFREVRIIHGKGTGTLREIVHAVLRRLPWVAEFRLGDEKNGSWGATMIVLKDTESK